MALSATHRRFLLVEQGAIPTAINFVLNGVIAWAIHRSNVDAPIWGKSSVALDLIATSFLLPFLTCVIASILISRRVQSGKMLTLSTDELPLSRWFRHPPWVRGIVLGIAGLIFGAAPIVAALSLSDAQTIPVYSFVAFKAVWAALLALLVTPVVGWWALASASLPPPART